MTYFTLGILVCILLQAIPIECGIEFKNYNITVNTDLCGSTPSEFPITYSLTTVTIYDQLETCADCRIMSASYSFLEPQAMFWFNITHLRFNVINGGHGLSMTSQRYFPPNFCRKATIQIILAVETTSTYRVIKPLGLFNSRSGTEKIVRDGLTLHGTSVRADILRMDLTTERDCALQKLDITYYDNNPVSNLFCEISGHSFEGVQIAPQKTIPIPDSYSAAPMTATYFNNECTTYYNSASVNYPRLTCTSGNWTDLSIISVRMWCIDKNIITATNCN